MSDQTFIACPNCGEPIVMSPMQLDIYRGRALTCARCARQFTVDPKRTPLYALTERGRARPLNPTGSLASAEGAAPQEPDTAPTRVGTQEAIASAPAGSMITSSPQQQQQHQRRKTAGGGGWKLIVGIIGGFLIVAAVVSGAIYSMLKRADEEDNRARCAANLVQINAAIQAYARSNKGHYPDSLERLLLAQTITPDLLICPSSGDTPVVGSTPQAWILALQQHPAGHNSYVYVGKNLTINSAATMSTSPVVMYEPMSNHHDAGATILRADNTVIFLDPIAARATIASVKAAAGGPASAPMILAPNSP